MTDARVLMGRGSAYGYVHFERAESAERARQEFDQAEVNSRTISVTIDYGARAGGAPVRRDVAPW